MSFVFFIVRERHRAAEVVKCVWGGGWCELLAILHSPLPFNLFCLVLKSNGLQTAVSVTTICPIINRATGYRVTVGELRGSWRYCNWAALAWRQLAYQLQYFTDKPWRNIHYHDCYDPSWPHISWDPLHAQKIRKKERKWRHRVA